ncbi:hypothetical protein COV04_03395 [Candidatus Uhrbacteria bacterium CG10_big_fil_rev_8_21_14_0_10_48_11]|uniref:Uncharacterized protein n=1 Tax=Candidatus Uhrbacteria bacterium CG10_big_fil_rev_8_21_14_0_10_48_11 TaxID=1975037 RepID=A0A2M8LEC3_9BACT|nr:MAG: hypothetical protein COV04_03395 [Candidatus Uhrbacteria bacterium CG10_big_fil_rev_8_21_14_0_10_48_11]
MDIFFAYCTSYNKEYTKSTGAATNNWRARREECQWQREDQTQNFRAKNGDIGKNGLLEIL